MRSRRIALVIALVLMASCSVPPPSVALTIAGTPVVGSPEGYCQGGACGGPACPPAVAPLTVVRTDPPIVLEISVGDGVTEINVAIWQGDTMRSTPIETFMLTGSARRRESSSMRAGHYYLVVTVVWSRFSSQGVTARAFLVDLVPR